MVVRLPSKEQTPVRFWYPAQIQKPNYLMLISSVQKITWTYHSRDKMHYYRLSEQRILRVLRHPHRIEEGIAPRTIAVMQSAGSEKHPYEIWAMYQILNQKSNLKNQNLGGQNLRGQKIRIISAWRYPGKSPKRNPIPEEILQEIRGLIK